MPIWNLDLAFRIWDSLIVRTVDEAAATLPDDIKPSELLGVDERGHMRQPVVAAHVLGGQFVPLQIDVIE